MLDPRIVRTLDADAQGHWLVFIARYCSDLYSQVSEGMEENEVLNFMMGIQFASTIEGRLTAGVATEDDLEWLQLAEDEMDERELFEDPLETIHVFGLVGIPHFDVGKQQDALVVTTDILALAGFDRNKYSVCLDITRAPQIYIEVLFDAVDETGTFVQKVSEGMRKVFEVLFVDHQVPGHVGVIIDGQNYPWINGRIER